MKWRGRRTSERIEDRRGGGSLGHRAGRGMKISGLGVVIVIVGAWFFGVDPTLLLSLLDDTAPREPARSTPAGPNVIDDRTEEFVGVVLADTEEVWQAIFADMDRTYAKPSLVLWQSRQTPRGAPAPRHNRRISREKVALRGGDERKTT